jgi:hypothetical protein
MWDRFSAQPVMNRVMKACSWFFFFSSCILAACSLWYPSARWYTVAGVVLTVSSGCYEKCKTCTEERDGEAFNNGVQTVVQITLEEVQDVKKSLQAMEENMLAMEERIVAAFERSALVNENMTPPISDAGGVELA